MRRLVYVPIIHTDLDLGSLAGGVEERAKPVVGGINWQEHKEVVRLYWQQIANYWEAKNVSGLKIFQCSVSRSNQVKIQRILCATFIRVTSLGHLVISITKRFIRYLSI